MAILSVKFALGSVLSCLSTAGLTPLTLFVLHHKSRHEKIQAVIPLQTTHSHMHSHTVRVRCACTSYPFVKPWENLLPPVLNIDVLSGLK